MRHAPNLPGVLPEMSAESRKWLNRAAEQDVEAKEGAVTTSHSYGSAAPSSRVHVSPAAQPQPLDAENLGVMMTRPRELGQACWDNDLASARRMITEGVDANDPEQFLTRSAPLSDAAYRGHAQMVQLLLDAGADPRWADEFCETALHRAAANGHEAVVQVLVKHKEKSLYSYTVDSRDQAGETPLLFAVQTGGSAMVVKLLLGAQADPTILLPQQANQTVLEVAEKNIHTAVDPASSTEMVALLRADVRVQRLEVARAECQQQLHGKRRATKDAIMDECDPIQAHINAISAATADAVYRIVTLGEAAVLNDVAAVKRLLSGRADPNNHGHRQARRRYTKTAKRNDFETKEQETKAMDEARERLLADIELGDPSCQFFDLQGVSGDDLGLCSPLWLAAHHGHSEIVKLLLNAKADPAWEDDDGATALHECARWWGHEDITQLLVDGSAPVDAIDGQGETALMCAAASGYTATVNVLLRAGADTTARTSSARFGCGYGTAIEIAESEEKWGVYVLLANPAFSVAEAEERAEATAEARLAGLADGPLRAGTKLKIFEPLNPWPPEPPVMSKIKRDASKEDRAAVRKEQLKQQAKAKRKQARSSAGGRVCVYKSWHKRSIGANLHAVRFEAPAPTKTANRKTAKQAKSVAKKEKKKGNNGASGIVDADAAKGNEDDSGTLEEIKLKKLQHTQWVVLDVPELQPEPEVEPEPQAEVGATKQDETSEQEVGRPRRGLLKCLPRRSGEGTKSKMESEVREVVEHLIRTIEQEQDEQIRLQ